MSVTSRDFQDDRAQQNNAVHGSSISVAATGVILTALPLGGVFRAVAAHGEIDVRSAPVLAEYVCAQVARGGVVVLDLTDIDFFGVAGLSVFEALDETCAANGASWVLCSGHPVRRLLQAAGRESSVRSFDSIDDALDSVM